VSASGLHHGNFGKKNKYTSGDYCHPPNTAVRPNPFLTKLITSIVFVAVYEGDVLKLEIKTLAETKQQKVR